MFTHYRRTALLLPALLFSMLLWGGCAASSAAAPAGAAASYQSEAPAAAAPAAMDGQVAQDQSVASDGVAAVRQIIAHASLELVVSDTQKVVDAITTLMNAQGGFVSTANLYRANYGNGELLRGTIQLRVPANKLEAVLKQLDELAIEVRSKTLGREDVTDQYSDLDAQLRNLNATENELRELLSEVRAKPNAKPDDILTVHNSLITIRGQIEQIQGRKNVLDNMISLSTIDITLTPDVLSLPVVEEGWRPLAVVRDATRQLLGTLQALTNAAIWFAIYGLPVLLLMGAVLGVLFWLVRLGMRIFGGARLAIQKT